MARENAGLSVLVDADASGEEKYAALEKALNKNLDPKLHVEINADGKINTEAKDPWKEQYLGAYLAPDADGTVKDRGAIVMYSKGSNLKLGSQAEIANGVVVVSAEAGKENEATDDYSLAVVYTYVNGYGEIQTATKGFSNNITTEMVNDSQTLEKEQAVPGLYQTGAIDLYESGSKEYETMMTISWNDLLSQGIMHVDNGIVYTNHDRDSQTNSSASILVGDLILPSDKSVNSIGELSGMTKVFIPVVLALQDVIN